MISQLHRKRKIDEDVVLVVDEPNNNKKQKWVEIIESVLSVFISNPNIDENERAFMALKLSSCSSAFHGDRCSYLQICLNLALDQAECLNKILQRNNVFITGSAGTGKSIVMKKAIKLLEYIQFLTTRPKALVSASTGTAAIAIGGSTIHSLSGIGIRNDGMLDTSDLLKIKKSLYRKGVDWKKTDVLFIDEISMLNADQFYMIHQVINFIHGPGLQWVVSGDFLQLPPVEGDFVFESPIWFQLDFQICNLTTPHRQKDKEWFEVLQEIRLGRHDRKTNKLLRSRIEHVTPQDEDKRLFLFGKRKNVDQLNSIELDKLTTQLMRFNANDTMYKNLSPNKYYPKLKIVRVVRNLGDYEKYFTYPSRAQFKIGCKVMLLRNIPDFHLSNGSIGKVIGKSPNSIDVWFEEIDAVFSITKHEVFTYLSNNVVVGRTQYPLVLAYAITIHKAQGCSLSSAHSSLTKSEIFTAGQAYVMLSRLREKNGLTLEKFDPKTIFANPKCIEFYEKNLS